MRGEQPAGDATRERILAALQQHRGLIKSDLCRIVGKGWGGMGQHIRRLAKYELIEVEQQAGFTWIFRAGLTATEKEFLVATRPNTARRILEIIGLQERANIRGLSDELALSKKAIRHHLNVLQRAGAVEKLQGHPPAFAPLQRKT